MAHTLPPLPYDKAALEPHIDAMTMEIHHDRHHNAYVTNLNAAIAGNAQIEGMSIDDLVKNLSKVPEDPFTQRPMIYHTRGTNWMFYSVGVDGVDDGGRPAGPGVNTKGDLFFDSP